MEERLYKMKSRFVLFLSALLLTKLSLIDAAPAKDYSHVVKVIVDHYNNLKQAADQSDQMIANINILSKMFEDMQNELKYADVQVELKNKIISGRDEEIGKLHQNIDEKEKKTGEEILLIREELNASIAQRNTLTKANQNLQSDLEIAKDDIKEKEREINIKNKEILNQSELLKNKEVIIEALNAQIVSKDSEIKRLNDLLNGIKIYLFGPKTEKLANSI